MLYSVWKLAMHHELRRLLTEFSLDELPRMCNAEILSRVEALRELGDAPHYLWRFPAGSAVMLAEMEKPQSCALNGRAVFSISLLEDELSTRCGAKKVRNANRLS